MSIIGDITDAILRAQLGEGNTFPRIPPENVLCEINFADIKDGYAFVCVRAQICEEQIEASNEKMHGHILIRDGLGTVKVTSECSDPLGEAYTQALNKALAAMTETAHLESRGGWWG